MKQFKKPHNNEALSAVIKEKAQKNNNELSSMAAPRSLKTSSFNKAFESMPREIQELATENFKKWKKDHNSINMKPLAFAGSDVWSAEINYRYRAMGVKGLDKNHNPTYVWFWIGSHEDYNKLTTRRENVATNITNIRKKYLTGDRTTRPVMQMG